MTEVINYDSAGLKLFRGLLVASRCHFSDKGCVSVASQTAEGQCMSCVPRSVFRYTSCVAGCWGKTDGSSVESGPGCLVSLFVCDAVHWVKLSKTWPKLKFSDLHKLLKKSTWGATGSSQGNENVRFMTFGVDMFSVQANKQSVISGFRRDVDESCALLGYYAASSDHPLPTFQDNVSVPSSRVKKKLQRDGIFFAG